MDPSSLIFVVIIAIWGAGLLGHWVRRRDLVATVRGVDRFSSTLRVLERRAPAPTVPSTSRGYVMAPPVPAPLVAGPVVPLVPSVRPAAVRRRRLLLAALAAATVLAWLLVALTAFPLVAALLVSAVLVGLVVHLRRMALASARRRAASPRPAVVAAPPRDERLATVAAREVVSPVAAAVAVAPAVSPDAAADVQTPAGWQPVPVPPPTYTLKPKAPAVVRPTVAEPAAAGEPVVYDLDEVLERRIASGA